MEDLSIYESLLALPSLKITQVLTSKTKIDISCKTLSKSMNCSICHKPTTSVHQYSTRQIRDLNMGIRHVYLHVKLKQFHCRDCGNYFTEKLDFVDSGKSYTIRQTDFMFMVGQQQSYQQTGSILDVNSKTVERIILDKCEKKIALSRSYAQVRRLGIDEQSHRKGKKDYICVLTDLDKGTLIDILADRSKKTLLAHFKGLGEEFCKQITDVSCDNWQAYIAVAQECFPQANIILDRFHITKQLNEGLDVYRKELRKQEGENLHFKKIKWILFKQYHKLTDQALDALDLAFADAPKLKELYFMREKFHHILDNNTEKTKALADLKTWINEVKEKQINHFDNFINSLDSTKNYVVNYVQDRISNALTEGLNNIIRVVRRLSFGMPNFKHLRLRALAFYC
jgi:transposase